MPGETLYMYLFVTLEAVLVVLVQDENGAQRLVYYTSHALRVHLKKKRYPPMEQLELTLVVASCCLRPYFQAHPIKMQNKAPLKKALQRPDMSEWLVN